MTGHDIAVIATVVFATWLIAAAAFRFGVNKGDEAVNELLKIIKTKEDEIAALKRLQEARP